MRTLSSKFLLAAALLATTAALPAASFFPTSPLIQIGDDTDIFFEANASLNVTDNLYSSANKTSSTYYSIAPGFALEYAKDSPLFVSATVSRALLYYVGLSKLNNSQDTLEVTATIDPGGPLKVGLETDYHESARNDNLTSNGIDGKAIGESLVRQGDYLHSLKLDYRLTEKFFLGVTISNSYNRYLNPITIKETSGNLVYNTNPLNEINTKKLDLKVTYNAPGDLIIYGFNFIHSLNDFKPAPYYSQDGTPRPEGIFKSTQDNFQFTASGNLTRSGKLGLNASAGFSSTNVQSKNSAENAKTGGASYSVSLNHNLTELISHQLTLSRSVSPTPNGANSLSNTYSYSATYSAADNLSFNFHVTRADAEVGATQINTMNYGLGALYNYNSHFNLNASIDSSDTKFPKDSTNNFQSNSFSIGGTFRY